MVEEFNRFGAGANKRLIRQFLSCFGNFPALHADGDLQLHQWIKEEDFHALFDASFDFQSADRTLFQLELIHGANPAFPRDGIPTAKAATEKLLF